MVVGGKFGNVVLCEHVVLGAGNKHTLVNAYSGDILVSQLPARLMMGLYAEYLATADEHELQLEISLDGKTLARARVELEAGRPGIIVLPVFPVDVDNPATLTIRAISDTARPRIMLRKKIAQAPQNAVLRGDDDVARQ